MDGRIGLPARMTRKIQSKFLVVAMVFAVACLSSTKSYALFGHDILINQNYDTDTVGQMPSGWTGLSLVNSNAFVTNNVFDSSPNSFANQFVLGDPNYTIQTVAPFTVTLTNVGKWISYEFDVNVDYIGGNDGEGFQFRLWNANFSQIDVGTPRILRNGAQWRFYNGLVAQNGGSSYVGNYNFDQWYNFRVQIELEGTNGPVATPYHGKAYWYVDSVLVNTETWTNRNFGQVREIDTFDIRPVIGTATGARMFIDNLGVEAIPEPSALAFVVAGAGMFLLRRRS